MANGKYHDLFSVITIQCHIGSMSKLNYPFSKLCRHFFDWPANLWVLNKRLEALPNCLYGPLGGVWAPGCQKIMKTGYI